MEFEKLTFETAKRLKQLREEKGISVDILKKELKEKYDFDISRESLLNYEVVEEHHIKARANDGMRIKTLRYFADFYGVSTDYLLGISDYKNIDPNITNTQIYTGLSEKAIKSLISWRDEVGKQHLAVLSLLLENPNFMLSIQSLYCALLSQKSSIQRIFELKEFFDQYPGNAQKPFPLRDDTLTKLQEYSQIASDLMLEFSILSTFDAAPRDFQYNAILQDGKNFYTTAVMQTMTQLLKDPDIEEALYNDTFDDIEKIGQKGAALFQILHQAQNRTDKE